jgi:hypothetical protein
MNVSSKLPFSAGLFALCAFVIVNVLLATVSGGMFSRCKPVKNQGILFQACNSAVAEYRSKPRADVVLLGSSVLVAPIWSTDSAHSAGVLDPYHHHRCFALEHDLSQCFGHPIRVVCMAIPGAMISDLYLLADKVLVGYDQPSVVVIALCPRDFMDDLLTGETKTAVFQSLVSPQDLPTLSDMYFSSPVEKADFVLNNAVFLYGKRWRYQQKFESCVDKVLARYRFSQIPAAEVSQESAAGRAGQFLQEQDRAQAWKQSIEEYRARYKHFNARQFIKQVNFLDCLLKVTTQRNMKVILVNMPLTQDNLALMPKGLYSNYLRSVEAMATRYKLTLIDCQQDPYYKTPQVFYDTVHLNGIGGLHLVQSLSDAIAANQRLAKVGEQ